MVTQCIPNSDEPPSSQRWWTKMHWLQWASHHGPVQCKEQLPARPHRVFEQKPVPDLVRMETGSREDNASKQGR
jgi:hypothetical protein